MIDIAIGAGIVLGLLCLLGVFALLIIMVVVLYRGFMG